MKSRKLGKLRHIFRSTKSVDGLYPQFPPPPPNVLLSNRQHFTDLIHHRKYLTPPGVQDNPLYSLYRLYEYVILDENTHLRNEIEYFWRNHSWAVCDIPDPEDEDPERYAVLSCIPQLLVLAFNNNIELGLPRDAPAIMTHDQMDEYRRREKVWEKPPDWVAKVPPVKETLKIPYKKQVYVEHPEYVVLEHLDNLEASEVFREKNILTARPHIYFI
ncbi:predicted protein [Uncinocarpus reesii 1704]|uniref:Uncharacterized protein n=1 Tax=Uncinocarpus reesii (strain UAMH 1704) TaxID=336963 RepID=C4JUQ3_UNCRE|nr:uncharacterized protein UREG_04856 [Uncinocarpus reesii 1704]EEP80014.1 predicted protein [Uncinocarpus reesii 1704]